MSIEEMRGHFLVSEEYRNMTLVPQFASGGMHTGGLAIAGELGPELINTGPSRIFNAQDTARILSGGGNAELVEEMRELRQEFSQLRQAAQETASNTGKTASQSRRFADLFEVVTEGGEAMRTTP